LTVRWSSRFISGPLFGTIWLLLCGGYISFFIGWSVLPSLLPHEIALVVLAVVLPVLAVWAIAGAHERAAQLERVSTRIAQQVDRIQISPLRVDEQTQEALRNFRKDLEELNRASDATATRLKNTTESLAAVVAEAVTSVNAAVARAEYVRGDVAAAVEPLQKLTETLADECAAIQRAAGRDLSAATDRLRAHVAAVQQAVDRAIDAASARVLERAAAMGQAIGTVIDKAATGAASRFDGAAERVAQEVGAAAERMSAQTGTLGNLITAASDNALERLASQR
jgi:hypothetical protein